MADGLDSPATKRDLDLLRQDLIALIDLLRQDLIALIDQSSHQLVEEVRDMQTEVLRGFHNWASMERNRGSAH